MSYNNKAIKIYKASFDDTNKQYESKVVDNI